MGEGVSFHTFILSEDRCVRLLVKNLGRGMRDSVVSEELESLAIRVQRVTQLHPGRRDQNPAKYRPLTPAPLYQWSGACGVQIGFNHRPLRTSSVDKDIRGPKKHTAMQELPALRTHAV